MREQVQSMLNGSRPYRHSAEKIWLPILLAKNTLAIFFFIFLCIGAFFSTRLLDSSATSISVSSPKKSIFTAITAHNHQRPPDNPKIPVKPQNKRNKVEIPLNCSLVGDATRTCPANYYPSKFSIQNPDPSSTTPPTCPDYFRWIHEDLWQSHLQQNSLFSSIQKAEKGWSTDSLVH